MARSVAVSKPFLAFGSILEAGRVLILHNFLIPLCPQAQLINVKAGFEPDLEVDDSLPLLGGGV